MTASFLPAPRANTDAVRAKGVKISHETSIALTATDCAAVAPVARC
jgi:hypothetical protein